jgi:hypothetical protein
MAIIITISREHLAKSGYTTSLYKPEFLNIASFSTSGLHTLLELNIAAIWQLFSIFLYEFWLLKSSKFFIWKVSFPNFARREKAATSWG